MFLSQGLRKLAGSAMEFNKQLYGGASKGV